MSEFKIQEALYYNPISDVLYYNYDYPSDVAALVYCNEWAYRFMMLPNGHWLITISTYASHGEQFSNPSF